MFHGIFKCKKIWKSFKIWQNLSLLPLFMKHTHTHNRLTAFCPGLPGRLVPKETFTRSHPSCSSDILYQLPPSIASSLFNLCAWLSFCTTSLQVLLGLSLGLEPSTSYSIHFFTQSSSSFRNACPYHRNLKMYAMRNNVQDYLQVFQQRSD